MLTVCHFIKMLLPCCELFPDKTAIKAKEFPLRTETFLCSDDMTRDPSAETNSHILQ